MAWLAAALKGPAIFHKPGFVGWEKTASSWPLVTITLIAPSPQHLGPATFTAIPHPPLQTHLSFNPLPSPWCKLSVRHFLNLLLDLNIASKQKPEQPWN